MSFPIRNGGSGGSSSHRKFKYRRLSSAEKASENCLLSCDEDEDEIFTSQVTELKKFSEKGSSSTSSPANLTIDYEQVVDRPIKSGDTLTGIALKYRIPVSELKRVNRIIQEKEFFALKTVKIPIKANSMLVEILEKEDEENNKPRAVTDSNVGSTRAAVLGTRNVSSCSEYESDSELHVGYISIDRILKDTRTKKEAKRFLESMQRDLASIREKTTSYKDSLDEVAAVLTDQRFQPLAQKSDRCSGADWGISWWKILLVGSMVLVALPLLYIYFYLKGDDQHSDSSVNPQIAHAEDQ
ncbi:hypothetical protein Pcinc_017862 [Petrolisthes cinctipes]|uniref:LysM domain-containing protein n=1 Tax=Petrolisthes cinctipes TaxID=88211 RepID=A0AAE1FPG2_PETCI|nr:hypothetical protein Pcinc_017862 [Petrolisthes cinctipes]